MKLTFRVILVSLFLLPLAMPASAAVKASQQKNANCGALPDVCDATTLGACVLDEQNTGEHVNDVEVSTATPRIGDVVQVSCHMGDGGDTDKDNWELWYNDGNGWIQRAALTDPDGCGAGVANCVWGPSSVTISGRAGTQVFRCINSYGGGTSANACRTDSWYLMRSRSP